MKHWAFLAIFLFMKRFQYFLFLTCNIGHAG